MGSRSDGTFIVAFFNHHPDAGNAVRDLRSAGFRSDQIGTSYEDYDFGDRDKLIASNTAGNEDHRSFWEKVEAFFSGEDHDRKDTGTTDSGSEWSTRGLAIPVQYRDRISSGGELVTVSTADRRTEAEQILTRNNGQIDRDDASYTEHPATAPGMGQGTRADITGGSITPGIQAAGLGKGPATKGHNALNTADRDGVAGESDERRIQLISEVLRVRKERVARGEVRLRKEVRTETQNVQVPVTREEIVIKRTPAQPQRTPAGQIGANSEIRVPLSEERVEVDKVPVVTEEVRVAKRPVSETRNIQDQVRHEELEVEGAGDDLRGDVKKRNTA